ncbi:unnamed protein product [Hydatigera taeniaeformis]|uniref:Vta1 domain-containing protein n=1 Tax=Hydatigena taeniaeformis TaxID=6205 RepID=A0A0R3X346_HYDTA|nr:unnamed protein product [Hydatigera taeniaeformis]
MAFLRSEFVVGRGEAVAVNLLSSFVESYNAIGRCDKGVELYGRLKLFLILTQQTHECERASGQKVCAKSSLMKRQWCRWRLDALAEAEAVHCTPLRPFKSRLEGGEEMWGREDVS